MTEKVLYTYSESKITSEIPLSFNARGFEINESLNEIYIGDTDGNIHVYDSDLKFTNKFKHHLSEVSVIKLSNSGALVASGDSKKNVFIWDSSTKEIIIDRFVYHTAKVFDVAWSDDDKFLISGSLDRSIILWNIAEKNKAKVFEEVDNEVIYALTWIGEKEFICGGHSCVLKKFNI